MNSPYRQADLSKTNMEVPCEIYSRVVGYYRPVKQWNKGKQQEYRERIEYTVK